MTDAAFDLVQRQQWLDSIADPLTTAVHSAFERAGDAGRVAKNALHGTWLGHPLHPVLTDVPVGAWTTALVLDVAEGVTGDAGYGRAATVAIGFGLAGALGSAISGLTDWSETYGDAKRIGLAHGLINLAATTLYAASFAFRQNGDKTAGQSCSLAGLVAATVGAYLGGGLVYRQRIGVTHADDSAPEKPTRVLSSNELPEGAKRKVDAAGTAVMVARSGGRACALAEHCSHLGGPLSEGELKDGTIVCPWHASQFRLDDGEIVNGPATHPQPAYQTFEHDGSIEVGGLKR